MAIVDITAELAARNPSKRAEQIAKTLEALDESITMLSMVRDSVTLHDGDSTTVEAFQLVYLRLKRECGALMELLQAAPMNPEQTTLQHAVFGDKPAIKQLIRSIGSQISASVTVEQIVKLRLVRAPSRRSRRHGGAETGRRREPHDGVPSRS